MFQILLHAVERNKLQKHTILYKNDRMSNSKVAIMTTKLGVNCGVHKRQDILY